MLVHKVGGFEGAKCSFLSVNVYRNTSKEVESLQYGVAGTTEIKNKQ